jgi:hypothetical protein
MEEWNEARMPLAAQVATMTEEQHATRQEVMTAKLQVTEGQNCPFAEFQQQSDQATELAKSSAEVGAEMRALASLKITWEKQAHDEIQQLRNREAQMEVRVSEQAYSAGLAAEQMSATMTTRLESDENFGREAECLQQERERAHRTERNLEEESRYLQHQQVVAAETFEAQKAAAMQQLETHTNLLHEEMRRAKEAASQEVEVAAATLQQAATDNNGRTKARKTEEAHQQSEDQTLQCRMEAQMAQMETTAPLPWPTAPARRRMPELTAEAKGKGKPPIPSVTIHD